MLDHPLCSFITVRHFIYNLEVLLETPRHSLFFLLSLVYSLIRISSNHHNLQLCTISLSQSLSLSFPIYTSHSLSISLYLSISLSLSLSLFLSLSFTFSLTLSFFLSLSLSFFHFLSLYYCLSRSIFPSLSSFFSLSIPLSLSFSLYHFLHTHFLSLPYLFYIQPSNLFYFIFYSYFTSHNLILSTSQISQVLSCQLMYPFGRWILQLGGVQMISCVSGIWQLLFFYFFGFFIGHISSFCKNDDK